MRARNLIVVLAMLTVAANAQDKLPVIKSNVSVISIQDGAKLKKASWTLAPEAKPDVYEADLIAGKPHKVTFITDVDSISFMVEERKKYDFIIQRGNDLCYTQIVGTRFTPAALFDKAYQSEHKGKMFIEIPEVYELVNVAMALTHIGIEDRNMIYKNSEYYARVRQHFDRFKDHPLITELDSALKKNLNMYATLKMNGNAFEFDQKGRIVQSRIYDRTGFAGERSNFLRPYLAQLQAFADASDFRKFYKENSTTYQEQIGFYRDTANLAEMKRWLDKNFPGSNDYDSYKIIFSPLVAYNQSSTWFESNGFKELQPHVNFPYPQDISRSFPNGKLSAVAEVIFRGNIVFTEINHGYINPEADKYADRIVSATSNRDHWVDKSKGPGYYAGIGAFLEYMNWGLVSLRIADYAPRDEQEQMIAAIDRMMTERRGFPQFAAFDKVLVDLYRNRKPGQTVADLYPQIIEWFEKEN
nr:J336 [uncultured bacterium]